MSRAASGPSRTLDTLIAERYGRTAGYLTSCRAHDLSVGGRTRVVLDLCVDEPVRRHGIARALLGHVAGTMLSQRELVLTIATSLGNHAARATYEALGASEKKDGRLLLVGQQPHDARRFRRNLTLAGFYVSLAPGKNRTRLKENRNGQGT